MMKFCPLLFSIFLFGCYAHRCPDGEEYTKSSNCEESCRTFTLETSCGHENKIEGCYCKEGSARHPITGVCINKDCCPSKEEFDYNSVEGKLNANCLVPAGDNSQL